MNRILILVLLVLGGVATRVGSGKETASLANRHADRPNIVWIMSEDNSKHYLKLFDPAGADTPNISTLASQGVVFDNAFSNAPVCSVARTTLVTGMYAPRIGTQFHRKFVAANLPLKWKLFPELLREAGYFTTNRRKTDYNFVVKTRSPWDISNKNATWRRRNDPQQPFFHVRTLTDSHESSLHFEKSVFETEATTTSPDAVNVVPYHPNSEIFRYTLARYHDRIKVIDKQVGKIIAQLAEDDLLDDTFVFYFGDHGGVLPRSKGYIYESGLSVPLVVYVPKNWKSKVDFEMGARSAGFVEFVDFAPTVLKLAGVEIPDYFDGKPFLGDGVPRQSVESRQETFGYADRFDAKYDLVRSLRVGKFKYVRNFQAIYPDGLTNDYRYKMLAYQDWKSRFEGNQLDSTQRQFFLAKPTEMLFNLDRTLTKPKTWSVSRTISQSCWSFAKN